MFSAKPTTFYYLNYWRQFSVIRR